jgi:hypothetical protein
MPFRLPLYARHGVVQSNPIQSNPIQHRQDGEDDEDDEDEDECEEYSDDVIGNDEDGLDISHPTQVTGPPDMWRALVNPFGWGGGWCGQVALWSPPC